MWIRVGLKGDEVRAIKFRIWWPEKRQLAPLGMMSMEPSPPLARNLPEKLWAGPHSDVAQKAELSQFTGLLDANKREIYDGDIVRSEYTGFMYLVAWSDDAPGWDPFLWELSAENDRLSGRRVTVVGNRWENPQLAEAVEG
jgi:hypothetical protein